MKYDYFIASRFRNKDDVLDLARKIRDKGKSVYCFLESESSRKHVAEIHEDPFQAMRKFEATPDWQNSPFVKEIFETDMAALKAAEALVLLLPAGKSAHIESGVAYGLGKKLVVIGEQKETESLYLIFDEFYPSIAAFVESL